MTYRGHFGQSAPRAGRSIAVTKAHVIEDTRMRDDSINWTRCTCGLTIRAQDPEALAAAYAVHIRNMKGAPSA